VSEIVTPTGPEEFVRERVWRGKSAHDRLSADVEPAPVMKGSQTGGMFREASVPKKGGGSAHKRSARLARSGAISTGAGASPTPTFWAIYDIYTRAGHRYPKTDRSELCYSSGSN